MKNVNRRNKGSLVGTVIAVDALTDTVRFGSPLKCEATLTTHAVAYTSQAFDRNFFNMLGEIVKQEMNRNADMDVQHLSLVLPDQLFLLDTVSIPMIHRKAMQHSLHLAIESIYQNADELSLATYPVQQNKQAVTYGLVGVRREIIREVNKIFTDIGAPIHGITYASNATVNGAMALNAKLRNSTFLLLDIKERCARFVFVVRGCTMGYYDLPFGYDMMREDVICAEDMLFDHNPARKLVQSSVEKARARQLPATTMPDHDNPESEVGAEASVKSGRILPKFMQRPTPQSAQEYIYENFRIFLKWTLELIHSNREITSLAKIDTVYINMPAKYRFLFDVINKKHEGRGLSFVPLLTEEGKTSLTENLELYGGFFLNHYNISNTF